MKRMATIATLTVLACTMCATAWGALPGFPTPTGDSGADPETALFLVVGLFLLAASIALDHMEDKARHRRSRQRRLAEMMAEPERPVPPTEASSAQPSQDPAKVGRVGRLFWYKAYYLGRQA